MTFYHNTRKVTNKPYLGCWRVVFLIAAFSSKKSLPSSLLPKSLGLSICSQLLVTPQCLHGICSQLTTPSVKCLGPAQSWVKTFYWNICIGGHAEDKTQVKDNTCLFYVSYWSDPHKLKIILHNIFRALALIVNCHI